MILINGKQQDTLAATDRGLHYGDGLFETLAIIDGRAQLLEKHLDRLQSGCQRLAIPVPRRELVREEVQRLANGQQRGILKIILTRGTGGRGYRPPQEASPSRILIRYPWQPYPEENYTHGVKVRLCETPVACNPRLAGIKHLNRLEQVMARSEWSDDTIAEGLMCDLQGYLIEGTMSNLFLVKDGELLTPELSRCGVAGIMRGQVLRWAERNGIRCTETNIGREMLEQADEVFLSNSLIGIWPVRGIDEQDYPRGPLSARLLAAMAELQEE